MDDLTQTPQWTQDEAVAFECAREAINHVMAIYSDEIATEERKPTPDRQRLAELSARQDRLHQERVSLRVEDHAEIARIRAEYGVIVRQWNAGHASAAAE